MMIESDDPDVIKDIDGSEETTQELIRQNNDPRNFFALSEYEYVPLPESWNMAHVTKLIEYYQVHYLTVSRNPPDMDTIISSTGLSAKEIRRFSNNKHFHTRLQVRGINWTRYWLDKVEAEQVKQGLTPQQSLALAIITDPTARGNLRARLAVVGVSYNQYRNWMMQPEFQKAMDTISEKMVTDNINTVHNALVKKAESGDTQAMKLFYEVSGRHDPMRQQSLDMSRIVGLLLEVITRHVPDLGVLDKIETEFSTTLAGGALKPAELTGGENVHMFAQEMIDKYSEVEDADVVEETSPLDF